MYSHRVQGHPCLQATNPAPAKYPLPLQAIYERMRSLLLTFVSRGLGELVVVNTSLDPAHTIGTISLGITRIAKRFFSHRYSLGSITSAVFIKM